jgi:hypothetical protein
MNTQSTRTILLCALMVLLTSLAACTAGNAVSTDVEKVASVAAAIADVDLPIGYAPEFSASLRGYTVAAFNTGDGTSHLYLVQSENEADGEKLTQLLNELAPGTSDRQMTVTETRTAFVRGQATTLVIIEGVNSEGVPYRQATLAFQGKGGPALLVISEPVTRWNQETVDAFIASIH